MRYTHRRGESLDAATTPIAVAVAARLGGTPTLSALVSIVSGAIGGGDVEGAAAGMAMGVVGVLTALLAPIVLSLMHRIR